MIEYIYIYMYISVVLLCTKTERHALSHPSPGQDLEDFLKLVQLWVGKRSASNAQAAAFECLSLTHQCRLHHWIWGRPSKTPRPMFQTNLASVFIRSDTKYSITVSARLSTKKSGSLLFWSILMVIYSKLSECLCKIGDPTSCHCLIAIWISAGLAGFCWISAVRAHHQAPKAVTRDTTSGLGT